MKHARGYTLVEVAIVVSVVGIMITMMGPMFGAFLTAKKQAYIDKQALINQTIGQALLGWAAQDTSGSLPAPYTSATVKYYSAVLDLSSTSQATFMQGQLAKAGFFRDEINSDASGGDNVRVYQRVTDLSMTLPVYYRSGPQAVLTYQFGVVYSTACRRLDTTCNKSPIPGASLSMTAADYPTWTTIGTDKAAYAISTLPLQKAMLDTTIARIDRMRDAFFNYTAAKQLAKSAGDNTNVSPPDPSTMTNPTPGDNQDCADGWYRLKAPETMVNYVGLQSLEYGVTAWGGGIEYCRDYKPITTPPGQPPYYNAFRINRDVSKGLDPLQSQADKAQNIFFSF